MVFVHAHHAQIGVQGGKRIVGHFGACGGYGTNQGGFTRIGHTQQAHIGQHFQFQLQGARFALFARRGLFGRTINRRFKMDIAQAALAALGQAHALAVMGKIGHDFIGVGIANQRAHRHMQLDVVRTLAVAVGTVAFFAVFGLVALYKTVFHQCVDVFIGQRKHTAATPAVAAIRAAARHKFFAPKAHRAIAAAPGHHIDFGFVDKFHNIPT